MMDQSAVAEQLETGLAQLQIQASARQLAQLLDYLVLLDKWNQAYNLTAVRDPLARVSRHLLDSLSILPWVTGDELTDVGSGAGLPGIPLAILRPELQVLSLDSNGKKTRFQFQAAAALGLKSFRVQQVRAEALQLQQKSRQLVSRAFASLADFVRLTDPLATADARWLAMKGLYPEEELQQLPEGHVCSETHSLRVPGETGQRHLLVLVRQTKG